MEYIQKLSLRFYIQNSNVAEEALDLLRAYPHTETFYFKYADGRRVHSCDHVIDITTQTQSSRPSDSELRRSCSVDDSMSSSSSEEESSAAGHGIVVSRRENLMRDIRNIEDDVRRLTLRLQKEQDADKTHTLAERVRTKHNQIDALRRSDICKSSMQEIRQLYDVFRATPHPACRREEIRDVSSQTLRNCGREVVRALPKWFFMHTACGTLEQARIIEAHIRSHYPDAMWKASMKKCVVRPMFGSDTCLQNISARNHLHYALLFALLRQHDIKDLASIPAEWLRALGIHNATGDHDDALNALLGIAQSSS